jgi:hypothetical protein
MQSSSRVRNGERQIDQAMINELWVCQPVEGLYDRMETMGLGIGQVKVHMLGIYILN